MYLYICIYIYMYIYIYMHIPAMGDGTQLMTKTVTQNLGEFIQPL